jgi:hypothetical protein
MVRKHRVFGTHEVRNRAAEIRRQWTPVEKVRRTGLPPDMPSKLREWFLASPQHAWCPAGEAACARRAPR